ncbi:hypothetical protein U9M48_002199 [Paspalum notatum var. saurae]|uniref:Uncharacterized protein n=2 Tax=Paspalum notatum var. saurae TaxID=547442 RepID=A0AAQ3PPZ9_PASNO
MFLVGMLHARSDPRVICMIIAMMGKRGHRLQVEPPTMKPLDVHQLFTHISLSAEVMVATGTFATSFLTKDPRWSCSPRHRLVSASNLASPRTLGENIDLALL